MIIWLCLSFHCLFEGNVIDPGSQKPTPGGQSVLDKLLLQWIHIPCAVLIFHAGIYSVSFLMVFELFKGNEWVSFTFLSQSPAFYKHFYEHLTNVEFDSQDLLPGAELKYFSLCTSVSSLSPNTQRHSHPWEMAQLSLSDTDILQSVV